MKNILLLLLFLLASLCGYSQCITVNISASNPSICSGSPVLLTANVSGGSPGYSYVWSTGETTAAITVSAAGTFNVTVTDQAGCRQTKDITITSGVTPSAPTAVNSSGPVCYNTSAQLVASAPGGVYQWYDANHTPLAQGATLSTPNITAPTVFYVETTIGGCTSAQTTVAVTLIDNPVGIDATVCENSAAVLGVTGGSNYQWYDVPSGGSPIFSGPSFTTPVLTATQTYYVTSTANGCVSARVPVTAYVNPAPPPPTPVGAPYIVCSGSVVNLSVSGVAGAIFDWYSSPTGGSSLISSPDYTTPVLTETTTYYVQAKLSGCESVRIPVTVTVNQVPQVSFTPVAPICAGSAAILTATSTGGTIEWYSTAASANPLGTGNTFNTGALNVSRTYYVRATNGDCASERIPVDVTVNPIPALPTASGQTICYGTSTTLTAVDPGGTYEWFDVAADGSPIYTGAAFTTPVLLNNTNYYVQTTIDGCISPRRLVRVTVLAMIATPGATALASNVCAGTSATLTASGGSIYEWYDVPNGGVALGGGTVFVTPPVLADKTFYVQAVVGGCASARFPVAITVTPYPARPVIDPQSTVCAGSPITLTATSTSGTVEWYNALTGGTLLHTGNSYPIAHLNATTTFYAQSTSSPCSSDRASITVSVVSVPNPQFRYTNGSTYCTSSAPIQPVINNPGGTFTATGGLIIDPATGKINISDNSIGDYTISYTTTGACTTVTNAKISIVLIPDATFSYPNPSYCQDEATNPKPVFIGSASAGVFTASPAGLVFVNASTGEIDLAASNPGIYTITNTIGTQTGCATVTATSSVTIKESVKIDAGPDKTVANGAVVNLAGTVNFGSVSWMQTGGAGTFTGINTLTPTYTPAANETGPVTFTITSADPGAPCGPKSDEVIITYNPKPPVPTATPVPSVCYGDVANLSASGSAETYLWYDVPNGGTRVGSGPTFTTPPLTVSGVNNYYVEARVDGVSSDRVTVPITVRPQIMAPTIMQALPIVVCQGPPVTITASSVTSGVRYQLLDNNGTILDENATGVFNRALPVGNTTFFIQAIRGTCSSIRTQVDVVVNAVPEVTSAATGAICSGNAQNYLIGSDIPATYSVKRDQVAGITNPAIDNQAWTSITETLINETGSNKTVQYVITPTANGCPGTPFTYTVTVYPTPIVTSPPTRTLCNAQPLNYTVEFNTPGAAITSFSWSRAQVSGVTNLAVSGQGSRTIREVLFNETNAPINVTYIFHYNTATCAGAETSITVTVNPAVNVTSAPSGGACSETPLNYTITSNVAGATFSWNRNQVNGISNPAVVGSNESVIQETLVNTTTQPILVNYYIVPSFHGCPGTPFNYSVIVLPRPATPVANSNLHVCIGNIIHLQTAPVAGATYSWTGPNGFASSDQNPDITNATTANAGTYSLVVTVNECASPVGTVNVEINQLPTANAGDDQPVCPTTASVQLHGEVHGGVNGGPIAGFWKGSGTGTFSADNDLNAVYFPSAADQSSGSVTLTLQSASPDDCTPAEDEMKITFEAFKVADAGPDKDVCNQDNSVPISGQIKVDGVTGTWSVLSGDGTFGQSADQLINTYIPGANDILNGSVTLVLTASAATGQCDVLTDEMTINFLPPPTVDAGETKYVLKGRTVVLSPSVSDENVQYKWLPNIGISDNTVKNPVVTGGDADIIYTLTITNSLGCESSDNVLIKVSPKLITLNTFTPNGDGINDLWEIQGVAAYPNAVVDIFNRNGQLLFHSVGYGKPWDGTSNGKPVPFGTYYYVIDAKAFEQKLTGYITVVR